MEAWIWHARTRCSVLTNVVTRGCRRALTKDVAGDDEVDRLGSECPRPGTPWGGE